MSQYRTALVWGAVGIGSLIFAVFAPGANQVFSITALILPAAVLSAITARLGQTSNLAATVGGALVGVPVALLSHGFVFGFAYLFFLGFADEAVALLDVLRIDPQLTTVLGSPWTILLMVELVVVAPITEEIGKGLGGWLAKPVGRQQAFLAGVAAGTGFAIVENFLYASFLGIEWEGVLLARFLGSAVHPLATGLVTLGWWEWRQGRDVARLAARFLTGAGIHALWNGSLLALGVAETAFVLSQTSDLFSQVSLAYSAALGVVLAGVLWSVTTAVAENRPELVTADLRQPSTIGMWTVLCSSLLFPVAMLLLVYPSVIGR